MIIFEKMTVSLEQVISELRWNCLYTLVLWLYSDVEDCRAPVFNFVSVCQSAGGTAMLTLGEDVLIVSWSCLPVFWSSEPFQRRDSGAQTVYTQRHHAVGFCCRGNALRPWELGGRGQEKAMWEPEGRGAALVSVCVCMRVCLCLFNLCFVFTCACSSTGEVRLWKCCIWVIGFSSYGTYALIF